MATPEYHIVGLGRNLPSTIVGLGLGINHPGTDKEGKGTSGNRSSTSLKLRDTSTNHTRRTANRRHRRQRRLKSETAPTARRATSGNRRGILTLKPERKFWILTKLAASTSGSRTRRRQGIYMELGARTKKIGNTGVGLGSLSGVGWSRLGKERETIIKELMMEGRYVP